MKKTLTFLLALALCCPIFAQNESARAYMAQHPVNHNRNMTDFPSSDIQFWVGNGTNEAVIVFYWCQDTEIGLAYGYRWNGIITIGTMLNDLMAADNRLSIDMSETLINTYSYTDSVYNLYIISAGSLTYTYNGNWAMGLDDYLHDGDFFEMQEWGNCTTPANIIAVSDPNTPPVGPIDPPDVPTDTNTFDGPVGSEGCQAIYYQDSRILAWATSCVISRGYQDIATGGLLTSYGSESAGVGPASTSTADAVSLGDGGVAILTFETPIINGEGYDFAVFENSLNDVFLELAFVEVSSDGIHYYRFPATSNTQIDTQINNAGSLDARLINNLAGKYRVGYGTPFDLEELQDSVELDINNITHVKLIDVVGSIDPQYGSRDKNGRLINDPYPTPFALGGFDLSGVAVLHCDTSAIHGTPDAITDFNLNNLRVYPNPCQNQFMVSGQNGKTAVLYNAFGQELRREIINNDNYQFDIQEFTNGLYILQVNHQNIKIIKQ